MKTAQSSCTAPHCEEQYEHTTPSISMPESEFEILIVKKKKAKSVDGIPVEERKD